VAVATEALLQQVALLLVALRKLLLVSGGTGGDFFFPWNSHERWNGCIVLAYGLHPN
jgi:hypothetical protein